MRSSLERRAALTLHRAHSGGSDVNHFEVHVLHSDQSRISEVPGHRDVVLSGVGDVGPLRGLFAAYHLAGVAVREVVDGLQ